MQVGDRDRKCGSASGEPVGIELALAFQSKEFHRLEKEPDCRVEAILQIANDSGQFRELGPVRTPLSKLKWEEPPNPGTVHLALVIPWDGKDAEGREMRGKLEVQYQANLAGYPEGVVQDIVTAVSGKVSFIFGH